MELSQSSLAMLLLCGIPVGILLDFAYRITDISTGKYKVYKLILVNAKDCVFVILGAVAAVLEVYYLNDGDFRYLVVAGMLAGFWLSDVLFGKAIVRLRNTLARIVLRSVLAPLSYLWSKTIGPLQAKRELQVAIRNTTAIAERLTRAAENGFENNTEAKE